MENFRFQLSKNGSDLLSSQRFKALVLQDIDGVLTFNPREICVKALEDELQKYKIN